MLRLPLLTFLIAARVGAADLNGIPVPGRIGTPVLALEAGDSDLGSEGGASGDDWRVAHASLDWDHGWISACADLSILTNKGYAAESVAAGSSDSASATAGGSGRSDEITASLAYRSTVDLSVARAWAQFGPGFQIAGDLGGRTIQNDFHAVIGNPPSDLPYDHPGLRFAGLVHGGLGGRVDFAGPCAIDVRGLGVLTTSGWSRWRAECLVLVDFPHIGAWSGVRQDGAAGHALTAIADDVARHESGSSIVVGFSVHCRSFEFTLETSHTFTNGGQDGHFSISYAPP